MRSAALWAAGAALAFFLTAGAFLFLANLATGPAAEDLPATPARGETGPALDLDLNRDRLSPWNRRRTRSCSSPWRTPAERTSRT
jgi:hypothetical protein